MSQWKIAVRSLIRRPAFAAAVVALLSLGIGVNTALLSLVYTVLIKPLPYPAPELLVTVFEASAAKGQNASLVAPARLEDWNRLNSTFEAIAGSYTENVTDTSRGEPERFGSLRVSPRYFAVFGTPPLIGRTFLAEEEVNGGPTAAVISYGLWTRRYGRDPGVLQRRIVIAGKDYPIIGVMPAGFASSLATDLWIPAQTAPFLLQLRDARFYSGIGRMKAGIRLERARDDLARVQRRLGEQFPASDRGWSVTLEPLKDFRVGSSGKPLLLLLGSVGVLLLLTITNTASLVLAQLVRRGGEFAVRASLGATRVQVVASVIREIAVLTVASGCAAFFIAAAARPLMAALFADLPRIAELRTDLSSLAFAMAAALVAGVVFGLLPAITGTGRDAVALLRLGRAVAGRRQRLQAALVAAQIAVTMGLMSSAGLLVRSFYNLRTVDTGFDVAGTVTFHVGAAWNEDRARIGQMQERLIADLQRIPGVEAAGFTNFLPASGASLRYQVSLEGEANTEETNAMPAGYRTVSPGYLKALRAPLVSGKWCPEPVADFNAPRKAMVNRRFVEVYGRGRNIVGRHLRWPAADARTPAAQDEIVGVIGDMREDAINQPAYPYVYACAVAGGWPDPEYVVRASGDASALLKSVRDVAHAADPTRAVFGARRLEDYLDGVLDRPRSNARMVGLFAAAAMLLAAVGLYGLVTQMVSLRRREMGIRLALGARPAEIVGSLVARTVRLIAAGIACGLLLLLAGRTLLASLVFGVSTFDAASVSGAAVVLAAVSCAASFVGSRRAARVDPLEALRAE